ncbi:MAG TPA: ABC transporter permease [Actinomycetota bacterium]|nr:ABC transporter permease [Actinomycetota bacterium]
MATTEVSPTETRPPMIPRPRREWFLRAWTYLMILYLLSPVLVTIAFGFNDYRPARFNFVWKEFSFVWWRELFADPDLLEAFKNSIIVAGISTLVATICGTMIALALTRFRFRFRAPLNFLIFLPMATPEVVLGVSLLSLFVTLNFNLGLLTIIVAHIMFSISYVVVTVKARTSTFDQNLENAAADLGASPRTAFWTVTFPLIFPGIMAGAVLAFVLSIDDYVVTTFNSGGVNTFPLWIYGVTRFGTPGQINVLATIIFMVGMLYVLVSLARARRA